MEIVAGPMDWTTVDEQRWSEWLNTETGRRLLPKLLESLPGLLPKGDVNEILIRSGEVRGWQEAAQQLIRMAHTEPPPTPVESAYPPLEDDSKWSDGNKLNDPNPDLTKP
jgi:hypothetical protein